MDRLLAGHGRIGCDSNVLIYLLDGSGALADKAAQVVDAFDLGQAEGVLSTLAIAEICSGPARAGDVAMVERFADEIRSIRNLRVVALSAEIAVDAAVMRGGGAASLADSIQLATARAGGATAFVTNDRRIKSVAQIEVFYLDEL